MKRVGVVLREYKSSRNKNLLAIRNDVLTYLRKYDVEIICIPVAFNQDQDTEFKRILSLINTCEGILLPGGTKTHEIDLKIAKYLYEQDIPTFGICLGMQILSLAFQGTIKPIGNKTHQSDESYVHKIEIKKNSRLYEILKTTSLIVNSRHDEHITTTNLDIVATASDKIIEAVEDKHKKFFIGVEWHPESLEEDSNSKKLFDAFIDSL